VTTLDNVFASMGDQTMDKLLKNPKITQICVNSHDTIFFWDAQGPKKLADPVFGTPDAYMDWLDHLLTLTDAGYVSVRDATTSVIEASFRPDITDLYGSIHISTREITRDEPALTVRKQPREIVSLDEMRATDMMNDEMRFFLELAVRGRLNILVSGGGGAGKTTLARAFGEFIDPSNRVVTAEEIDELHLQDRITNAIALTTFRRRDSSGVLVRETSLDDLVREALRMRADRIWVGETRGREAYALVKACNSGHDGSVTTIHADSGAQAIDQLNTYVMESGLDAAVSQKQVSRAFNLVVQVGREKAGRRVIREITELEPALEGAQQRWNPLYKFNQATGGFEKMERPTPALKYALSRYGVNYDDLITGF
jgi:pilus assembly protein CpaF